MQPSGSTTLQYFWASVLEDCLVAGWIDGILRPNVLQEAESVSTQQHSGGSESATSMSVDTATTVTTTAETPLSLNSPPKAFLVRACVCVSFFAFHGLDDRQHSCGALAQAPTTRDVSVVAASIGRSLYVGSARPGAMVSFTCCWLQADSLVEPRALPLQPPQSALDSSATRQQDSAADAPAAGLSPAEDDLRAVWLLAFRFVAVSASKAAAQWLSPLSLPVRF